MIGADVGDFGIDSVLGTRVWGTRVWGLGFRGGFHGLLFQRNRQRRHHWSARGATGPQRLYTVLPWIPAAPIYPIYTQCYRGSHFFVTEGGFNIRANEVP